MADFKLEPAALTCKSEPATVVKLNFPESGQTFIPGVDLKVVEFIVTNKTTKKDLQDQLRLYGLPVKGSKANLLASLQEFSSNRDAWVSLFQPIKKRKRGVHNSRDSLSTKRIAAQFGLGEGEDRPVIAYKSKKSAGAVLKALGLNSEDHIQQTWHTNSEGPTVQDGSAPATQGVENGSEKITTMMTTNDEILAMRIRRLERKLDQGVSTVLGRVNHIQDTLSARIESLPPGLASTPTNSTPTHTPTLIVRCGHPATELPGVHHTEPTSHQQPIPVEFLGIACLDPPHTVFTFDVRHIPDPPAINFSSDIDRLFREWEASTLLVINGHGIPVKHWEQFYKKAVGAKDTAWGALKTKWGKWKFIVEERQKHPDNASFWHQFSTEKGERLCYQQVLNKIASARAAADAQDATNARLFFSGNLDHPSTNGTFRYTRSGRSHMLTKDSAIAKVWRTLLATQPAIAEQWEALCAVQHSMQHNPSTSSLSTQPPP